MSTRAVYTFKDSDGDKFAVYKHYDGYPSGAVEFIEKAREFAWPGQRFDAADFAAAFVAANKGKGGGDVYFTKSHTTHGDLSYDYVINAKGGVLQVEAFDHEWSEEAGEKRVRIFKGSLQDFIIKYAEEKEAA